MTETTESARTMSNPEVKTGESSSPRLWQSVLVGGIPGILIGASGTVAVEAIAESKKIEDGPKDPDTEDGTNEVQSILVAHSVTDDMSFSEAFAAARAEVGPGGAFVWHGHVYGTYRADDPEWQAMSDEDRTEHSHLILAQVHPTPYTPTENEPQIVPSNDGQAGSESHVDGNAEDTSNDIDVHIVGVGQVQTPDGSLVDVGYGAVDGHGAIFADADGDGEVDTVLIDVNDNGIVDANEAFDGRGSGITIEEMAAVAEDNSIATPDDSLYSDMPDYTNDADTGSYV